MSLLKQLAGQTIVYGLSTILPRILHFLVFTVYLTKRAFRDDPDLFGVYSDLYAYAGILLVLLVYRLDTAYFRYGSREDESTVFSTAGFSILATTLVSCVVLIILRQPIANFLTYPDGSHYVAYFAIIIGCDALAALPLARLRLLEKAKTFAGIKIVQVIINLGLVFYFLEIQPSGIYSSEIKLELLFISNLTASVLVLVFLAPHYLKLKLVSFSKDLWKRMLVFLMPLVVVAVAGVFNQSFAVPLIKYLLQVEDVESQMGLYSAAAKLAILMNLFTMAFNYAAEPFFFRQSESRQAPRTYASVAQAFCMVASVVLLGILLYLDLLQHLIGENYWEALPIVPILLVAFWFLGLYYNLSVWYKINDLTKYGALISTLGVIVTLVVTILLIDSLGKVALAWAALACYLTMNIVSYFLGRKYYPIPYPLARMLAYLVGALAVYFAILWLRNLSDIPDLLLSTLGITFFVGILWFVERRTIRNWATQK